METRGKAVWLAAHDSATLLAMAVKDTGNSWRCRLVRPNSSRYAAVVEAETSMPAGNLTVYSSCQLQVKLLFRETIVKRPLRVLA